MDTAEFMYPQERTWCQYPVQILRNKKKKLNSMDIFGWPIGRFWGQRPVGVFGLSQSHTQSPQAFWSADGRQQRLWETGILFKFF